LHRSGAERFGWPRSNYVGSEPQDNTEEADWPSFYVRRRLEPQLERAHARGLASASMRRGLERLVARMPELAGAPEPPSRLHGDLWSGNAFAAADGAPVLIDPAVYGGHREIDLAMMRLFGGFSERVFDAYEEEWPLAPGNEARVALYQLYPLLVHVNLFGAGYAAGVERALATLV
jgi:protein-ribulosamine 3-kinase